MLALKNPLIASNYLKVLIKSFFNRTVNYLMKLPNLIPSKLFSKKKIDSVAVMDPYTKHSDRRTQSLTE